MEESQKAFTLKLDHRRIENIKGRSIVNYIKLNVGKRLEMTSISQYLQKAFDRVVHNLNLKIIFIGFHEDEMDFLLHRLPFPENSCK